LLTLLGVAAVAGATLAGWLLGASELVALGAVLSVVLPFLLLREHVRRLAFAHLRLITATLLDTAVAGLQLGGLLLVARAGWLSVPGAFGVMGLACAVPVAVWFLRGWQFFSFSRADWWRDWRHDWAFSKWTLAGFLAGSAPPFVLPWLLAFSHGEAAAGFLAACQTLVGVSNLLVTGISNVLTTQAAHAFTTGGVISLWRVIVKTAALFSLALGGLCAVFVLAGETLLAAVFQAEFAGAGPVLTLLSLSVLAQGLSVTAGNGLWAIERPRTNFVADLCSLVIALGTAAILVAPLGVLGVAIAAFAGATGAAVVRWFLLLNGLQSLEHTAAPA
jgi:O-antigen/teichoic acid export membrane protein